MLKLSVQTGGIEEAGMTHEEVVRAYQTIREAGFDGADANIDHLISYRTISERKVDPMWLSDGDDIDLHLFDPWKDGSEKGQIKNTQAHAPFPSRIWDPDGDVYNRGLLNMLKKMIHGCAYIGCDTLIIHPFLLTFDHRESHEAEWNTNIASYSELIATAQKYHVTICLENMFCRWNGKMYEAACSDIDTACRYVDTLNEIAGQETFGFCLDTGHLLLLGKDVADAMVRLGSRIKAFHVHDNDGINDQHLAPYFGIQDWSRFVEGLKAIRFNRPLSFETYNIWNRVDREVAPDILAYICHCGRMFSERAGL